MYFMEATHPSQANKVTCGWILKGQYKAIKTTGNCSRIKIVGAINLNHIGNAYVKRFDQVNRESIEKFFEQLRAELRHHRTSLFTLPSKFNPYRTTLEGHE